MILDFFLKRNKYKENKTIQDFNWFNLAGIIIGAIVANMLQWGIAAINAMVVAGICYLIGYVVKKEV